MTANEFSKWLEGYLEDRDNLTKKQIDKIWKKAKEITTTPTYIPYEPWTLPKNPYPLQPWITYSTTGGTSVGDTDVLRGVW